MKERKIEKKQRNKIEMQIKGNLNFMGDGVLGDLILGKERKRFQKFIKAKIVLKQFIFLAGTGCFVSISLL